MQRITEAPPHACDTYLAAVQDLTSELRQAITALKTGILSDFETSLVRQRISYTRLAELKAQYGNSDPAFMRAFHEDHSSAGPMAVLEAVTRDYSMLVKHLGGTTELFAGVFRKYGTPTNAVSSLPASQRPWSCQL